ncbi:MAG TPA: imidazolonepropionase [Steroidobacteraceae bacterium]|jgi:imidazolonepropionase|nr:imidazolonepropionase [Steroidobacteraceae bacterium]
MSAPSNTVLWRNARLLPCDPPMSRILAGAIVTEGERLVWVGREADLPAAIRSRCHDTHDLHGAWVTPGLIDCHTHLVFAGTRAAEYAQRLRGVSYEEIARQGGGILNTVRDTRAASDQQLFEESAPRLASLLAEGVTTVEIKSGYGLSLVDERRMLRVARRLGESFGVRVHTGFLAAHALPPEFTGRAADYIDAVARQWLPALHGEGLVDSVDIFCENIGFSADQAVIVFEAANRLGLPVKMHAEQLSNIGGSQVAARFHALSCDHLEYTTPADAAALAAAGTVAVLLPVAFYGLRDPRSPPIAAFRGAGTRMAVATDCNPGSAPGASLLLAMSMATRFFGLTPEEVLAGVTCHAARALGLAGKAGTLAAGGVADFVVWAVREPEELGYWAGLNLCRAVVRGGRLAGGALPKA